STARSRPSTTTATSTSGSRRSSRCASHAARSRGSSRNANTTILRPRLAPSRRAATLSGHVSDRRKYLLLMGAIVAALVGALLLAIPGSPGYKKPVGGLEVVLQAVPPKGHQLTSEDLDRSISIMQNRINMLGVSEPEIRKQGKDQ